MLVQDWWNATTIGDYWRLWNMPVHKWLLRHVFAPAQRALGFNKFFAMTLVFCVSAAFHELLVGWPLHMVKGWAFWGVLGQVCTNLCALGCDVYANVQVRWASKVLCHNACLLHVSSLP